MKKEELIKQLANRINQPHVIESWVNKIEKAAYKKGKKDSINSLLEELKGLKRYEVNWHESSECTEDFFKEEDGDLIMQKDIEELIKKYSE